MISKSRSNAKLKLLWITVAITLITPVTFTGNVHAQEDILQENDFLESPDMDMGDSPGGDDVFGGQQNTPPPPPTPNNSFAPTSSGPANPAFSGTKKRKTPPLSQATDADITNENYPDLIDSFDFPNADIADVIKAISELTGKNFIVDPNVSGKITIMAPTQITVAEAYKVFLSALAIRGFSIVPSGKFLKILPVRDAQRDNLEIFSGAYTPDTDQMITRIIHLKYVPAAEMNKFATKLVSKNGNIDIYEPTNSLIVSDQASSVQRLIKIVGQLDIAGFDEQLAVINIKNAKAKDIADLIDQIINKGQKKSSAGAFSSGIPRFRPGGQSQSTGGSAFSTVIPDDRTNSVIVVGNKSGIDKIRKLVATLDFRLSESSGGAYVYYVKHGEAEKISDIINGIAKQLKDEQKGQAGAQNFPPPPVFNDGFGNPMGGVQSGSSSSSGLFGADVKISADKDTNSLIIVGSKQDYQAVLALLNKIDIPRDQVYVEAIIMEMVSNDSTKFGISYYKFEKGTEGLGRAGFGGHSSIASLAAIGGEGAILGFGSGETVPIKIGGQTVNVKSLMGFLSLLKQNTKSDVLATPQIIAMDNEEATVEVGQEVPIAVTAVPTGTGGATSPNVERVKATIKLVIKPHISPSSETVRLNIKQTIKQVDANPTDGSELGKISRTTSDRAIETNIVMRDGDTAVLGGLMRDAQTETVIKVPLLGDIPVLGWLFKSTENKVEKQNLIVFITPKVIRNPEDSGRLLSRKLDDRVRNIKENFGGKDRHGAFTENMRPKLKPSTKTNRLKEQEDEFIEE
ncbi:MAG: type II secretion system secretin GspD [Bdellovibrionota bacterium]